MLIVYNLYVLKEKCIKNDKRTQNITKIESCIILKEIQNEKKRKRRNRCGCKRERERESRRVKKNCSFFDVQKAELKEYIDVRTGYRKKRKEASFTDGYNENSKEMRCESKIAEGDFFRNVDVETGREKTFIENNLSFLCALRNRELTSERGITLLSLIITVVIMIILAGVTINVTLGDGGLVDQAKWAAEQTANSTQSEQEQLENVASQVNDIIAGIGIGGDTNSTGGEETNSVDTNSVEETNTIDTN